LIRYWDPYPLDQPIPWLTRDEIPLFDARFEQAVSRSLIGPAGIFLSGGLDSVSVAAVAVDLCARRGIGRPLALSLGFPDPECNEEDAQRSVAAKLGIESELVHFWDAAGGRGLIEQSLEMSRTMPAPMLHTWNPAYSSLALRARERGITAILTGGGGDEWLGITPKLAADLIRTGDIGGLVRFLAMWRRSYPFSVPGLIKSGLWRYGLRPVAAMMIGRAAPQWWRRNRARRVIGRTPDWVAPDPQLRRVLDERTAASVPPADPVGGFYAQDIRMSIDHTLVSMEFEESALFARRHGLRFLRPYFDIDLVELLYRTPPDIRLLGGRSKALVRDSVARRFPNLGFEQQKKRAATGFYRGILLREIPPLWDAGGGLRTLATLGIVSHEKTEALRREALAKPHPLTYKTYEMWNIEHWTRART
jgi:asparagine synthetase B (glutamine-hydrolysing)